MISPVARDECTHTQRKAPGGSTYLSWVSKKDALKGARFGVPLERIWKAESDAAAQAEYRALRQIIERIRDAGAEVIMGTDFPSAKEIIPPNGWDW